MTSNDRSNESKHFETESDLQAATQALTAADPALQPLLEQHGLPSKLLRRSGMSCFHALAKSIIYQQLSGKAAASIFTRVLQTCQCSDYLKPGNVLEVSHEALRTAGLSNNKARFVRDLAERFDDGRLCDEAIFDMDAGTLERELTQVLGIGVWTVHMFQMFHLGHHDVLPLGDLAVKKGMAQLYGLKVTDTAAMEQHAERWRPYRSVGTYFMWRVETQPLRSPSTKRKSQAVAQAKQRRKSV